ncbi:hypothetical protein BH10BAC2_BH10BAC2_31130 [soil metagenome]
MHFSKVYLFLCITSSFTYNNLYAQPGSPSSHKQLFTEGERQWFKRNLPEAVFYLSTYIKKEKQPTDSNDFVNANDLLAVVYLTKSMYDSALYFSSAAFAAIVKIHNKRLLPNLYQNKARLYNQLGDLENTIKYFLIADSLYAVSDEKKLRDIGVYTATALGNVFQELRQYDKAKEYYERAIQKSANHHNIYPLVQSLEALASLYVENKEYEKATDIFYNKVFPAIGKDADSSVLMYTYLVLGDIHRNFNSTDSAFFYYNRAIIMMYQGNELYKLDMAFVKLAGLHLQNGNLPQAKKFCDSTLKWARQNNNPKQVIACYQLLAEIAVKEKRFEKALFYVQQKEQWSDSLLNSENIQLSNKLYVLNKVKEKDLSIASLSEANKVNEALIKERETINYLLIGLVILSLLLSFIFFNRLKLKKQLEQHKAVTNERQRIITDLHDDVGATLSSMHIYGGLAENVWYTQPEASKEMVTKITQQSKDLMARMGDIIWSMKPADEEKYTLEARLKNYCNELLAPKNIPCYFSIDEKLAASVTNPEARKNILLIAKEAINNISKYSGARRVYISLLRKENSLFFSLTDDGKGFELATATLGNGLHNIQLRCKQLNGLSHIVSGAEGTSITCTFPIAIISHIT